MKTIMQNRIIASTALIIGIIGIAALLWYRSERAIEQAQEEMVADAMASLTAPSFTDPEELSDEQKQALRSLTAPQEPATTTAPEDLRRALDSLDARPDSE